MTRHPTRKRLYYGNTPHPHLPDGIYAVIGPFTHHEADPDLQYDIEPAVARFNHRNGLNLGIKTVE